MRARTLFEKYTDDDATSMLPPSSGVRNGLPVFSWDQAAVQLNRGGESWNGTLGQPITVTYAYRASGEPAADTGVSQFTRFNAAQIAATEIALDLWSDVANITFQRVGGGTSGAAAYSNNATMLFGGFLNGPAQFTAFAYLPDPDAMGAAFAEGDLWFNLSRSYMTNPGATPQGAQIIAHEIGHTLGLLHPSDYGGGAQSGPTYQNDADYWQDTHMFTLMSYFSETSTGASWGTRPLGPQLHDIAAAQRLYGVNMTTRTGDTVYGFHSNSGRDAMSIASASEAVVFTIWDAGGTDTLDLSGYNTNSEIDLRPEAFSSAGPGASGRATFNIAIARGALIENAIGGGGADSVTGNELANTLTGNAGPDTMIGNIGNDRLIGGGGADYLIGSSGGDILEGGQNNDKLDGGGGGDQLTGGAGADAFVFSGGLGAPGNVDTITDFNLADDTIKIDNNAFAGIGAEGALAAQAFYIGAAAHDASDRIIYNAVTGSLYFDSDGTGATAQIRFAILAAGLALTSADFLVI